MIPLATAAHDTLPLPDTAAVHPVDDPVKAQIIRLLSHQFVHRATRQNLPVRLTDAAMAHLDRHGPDPRTGVRPLKRYLGQQLGACLGPVLWQGDFEHDVVLEIDRPGQSRSLRLSVLRSHAGRN